jgi:Ca2+-binding EF-hand superfamily protein
MDKDNDGKVNPDDLVEGFKHVMMEHLNDADVTEIATQTIKFADHDGDNALNFEEFKLFYNNVLQITI